MLPIVLLEKKTGEGNVLHSSAIINGASQGDSPELLHS